MDNKLSLILSLIGCITGFAGLAINFHKFLSEQFKLKVYFAESENYFFNKIKETDCKTNFQGIIRICFVNSSSSPVTIYEINTSINNNLLSHSEFNFPEIRLVSEVFTGNKYITTLIPMDKQIELPLRIEPYDSYEGYMFFPFFPDTKNKIETVNFTFKTTKKVIRNNCKILMFQTKIHDDCNDDYI